MIIDSAAFATGEPESAEATAGYFNALRALEVTTLTIAHVSKTGQESHPYGSIFWKNGPRSIYRALSEQRDNLLHVGIRHTKANNGPLHHDRAFDFTFGDNIIMASPGEPRDIEPMEANAPLASRIMDQLEAEALKPAELAETLGTPAATVRSRLSKMAKKQRVVRLPDGKYGIASKAERT